MALGRHIDPLLQQAVEAGDVPGVVAVATNRDHAIYTGAFGTRAVGGGQAMTADTVCWMASMTKALTGLAAMQQVEQGRLELDAPASRVVPALGRVQVLQGFDSAGEPVLRAPTRPITLRHLLTHTAGFGYDIWSEPLSRYQQKTGTPGVISCQNKALEMPLLFDPGERWEYGINIDYAGKMVEAVSGLRLGEYLQRNVFEPLGMHDTGFRITPAMRARLAKVHQRDEAGRLQPTDIEVAQEPEFDMGGGGLYGTAGDYIRFVRMMLNQGKAGARQIVRPETVALMARNAMGESRVTLLRTAKPAFSNDAEFLPGLPKSWGLSFMINEAPAWTGRSAGSLAWAGLANTYFWIDPAKGLGGVYFTQMLPFADRKSLPLFHAFEQAVYEHHVS